MIQTPEDREATGAQAYGSLRNSAKYAVGYSVSSPEYGMGRVVEVAEDGPSYKYLVEYSTETKKRIWVPQSRMP